MVFLVIGKLHGNVEANFLNGLMCLKFYIDKITFSKKATIKNLSKSSYRELIKFEYYCRR